MHASTSVVGIDVSKATLDVFVLPQKDHFVVANDPAGISDLLARMLAIAPGRIVLEATGGLEFPAARALSDAGLPVSRINPARIHAFRKTLGKHAKTDKLDAALIVESLNDTLKILALQRKAMEAALVKAIAANAAAQRRFEILTSIPSFGPVVATTLVTDMPEPGRVNRQQIASLAGLAPHDQQSGTSLNKANIHGGRPCVRTVLYMAALVASRSNPDARTFYQTLVKNGKNKKLALVAVARKLITLANQLIREDRLWTPKTA